MRKSILLLVIVGAFVTGSVLTPQYAEADHDTDFAELASIVGILFNGINDGFAILGSLIADIQVDVDTNTQSLIDGLTVLAGAIEDVQDDVAALQADIAALPLPNSVGSNQIIDGTILFTDISQNGCAANQIIQRVGGNWVCADAAAGPPGADGADGADGSDGISPLTSIRVTTTEPEFLLPTDETVIGVAPTSHIFLPLGIPDGKIIVIKNAGCGCILSAQEDDEILNGDIILGFTDAVALQYLNGIWFEIAEYAGLPAPP